MSNTKPKGPKRRDGESAAESHKIIYFIFNFMGLDGQCSDVNKLKAATCIPRDSTLTSYCLKGSFGSVSDFGYESLGFDS